MRKYKQILFTVPLFLLVVALIISNIYFLRKANTPDCILVIGIPQTAADGEITAVDYTKSRQLDQKSDINTVVFSITNAQTIQNTEIITTPPNAVLSMTDSSRGISFLIRIWLCEDSVIFTTNPDIIDMYREIRGTYGDALREIVQDHISRYQ